MYGSRNVVRLLKESFSPHCYSLVLDRESMEPSSFGRKVGMGVRIASNIARERAAEAARKSAERAAQPPAAAASNSTGKTAGRSQEAARQGVVMPSQAELKQKGRDLGRGIGRGTKSFGQSFFGPFAHAGGVLWLEITGCFFALFAAFFAQNLYVLRAQYAAGPLHQKFMLYGALCLVFLYFSASSFLRAKKKSRKQKLAGR